MKVLMLSTDENIFKENAEVRRRIFEYGSLVNELHVIVKNQKSKIPTSLKLRGASKNQNFRNIFIYPTNDRFWFLYFFNAYRIGKSVIRNWKLLALRSLGEVGEIRNCVVTCQDPFENGLIGYLIKRKFNVPLQLQVHTDFLSPYFWRESLKNKIRVVMGKWLIQKADGLRVVSERIKSSIIVNCKLKIENSAIAVLPIFIDIQKIKNSPLNIDLHKKYPGKFIILMASRLTKEKNIGLAIKATSQILKESPEALLLIVGSGPESKKLKAKSYKLKANVVFEPWSNDLSSYYKTADLFLLTSNYEGYGMTAIEASAADLPVVMTNVGVSIGLVSKIGDYKDVAHNVTSLIKDPRIKDDILKKQRDFIGLLGTKENYLDQLKKTWLSCLTP